MVFIGKDATTKVIKIILWKVELASRRKICPLFSFNQSTYWIIRQYFENIIVQLDI